MCVVYENVNSTGSPLCFVHPIFSWPVLLLFQELKILYMVANNGLAITRDFGEIFELQGYKKLASFSFEKLRYSVTAVITPLSGQTHVLFMERAGAVSRSANN